MGIINENSGKGTVHVDTVPFPFFEYYVKIICNVAVNIVR